MIMSQTQLSVIIPHYHEPFEMLQQTYHSIGSYLQQKHISHQFVICQNGAQLHRPLDQKHVITLTTKRAGLGVALRMGIECAQSELVAVFAADNAFKGSDLQQFVKWKDSYDLVWASKLHPDSVYQARFSRKLGTKLNYVTRQLLFPRYPIHDPNANFLGKTSLLKPLATNIATDSYIFTTELAYRAHLAGAHIKEVPIIYRDSHSQSSVNVMQDGYQHFFDLIHLRLKTV